MKKIVRVVVLFMIGLFIVLPQVKAENEVLDSAVAPVNVYLFYGEGCGYCKAAMEYFNSLEEEYGYMFDVVKYETWSNTENQNLLKETAAKMGDTVNGVPYIVIGKKSFGGYDLNGGYDADILKAITDEYKAEKRYDVMVDDKLEESNIGVYAALAVIILALGGLLVFSKTQAVEETEKESLNEEKEEVVVEEKPAKKETTTKKEVVKNSKKEEAKKEAPAKKKTATAKKSTSSTKKSTGSTKKATSTAKKTTKK